MLGVAFLALGCLVAGVAAGDNPLLGRRGSADKCAGGACCGMAYYPAATPGGGVTEYYAEFDVPGLPEKQDGITYYIYFNIFFRNGVPNGKMNQFVPQLMLGNALSGSSGPPLYNPIWHEHTTWVFGSQYFMEIFNVTANKTQGKAAHGQVYPCKKGEVLWTRFTRDSNYVWTLAMGVKGDSSRTSTVVSHKPYMGLLEDSPGEGASAPRWSDSAFASANVNSCWELYGMRDRAHYPSSGSSYDMVVKTSKPGSIKWDTHWTEDERPTCPGGPQSSIKEEHTDSVQHVYWNLTFAS
eukprot:Sspe_Gene.6871::Locus_2310_Transcript_1_1_Confidence_1.000_Length_1001::g.6871::m.6871